MRKIERRKSNVPHAANCPHVAIFAAMSVDPLACAGVCAAYLVIKNVNKKRRKELQKRLWMKDYFRQNKNTILQDLQSDGDILFKNFTRMSLEDLTTILEKIRPQISKKNTVMREAIPAEIRLAITLRYLATGDSYASLSFLFKVSKQSISYIVSETMRSINEALKDYIKVYRPIVIQIIFGQCLF